MSRRDVERMKALIRRAVVVALAAPSAAIVAPFVGCSSKGAAAPDAGAPDSTANVDVGSETTDAGDAGDIGDAPSLDAAFWAPGCAPVAVADADDCIPDFTMPCGAPDGYPNGPHAIEDCWDLCPPAIDGGGVAFTCSTNDVLLVCTYCTTGRRPAGWRGPSRARGDEAMPRWLANVALLESASVDAFASLRRELRAHGAPRSILRSISRARRDEVRHARAMRAHAKRHGAQTDRTRVATQRGTRALDSIAVENAIEGCVRETFGAALAYFQSMHARDRALAATLARIAHEETTHAALSARLARWMHARLSKSERARVESERRAAARALRADIERAWPSSLGAAGMPTRAQALALFDATISA